MFFSIPLAELQGSGIRKEKNLFVFNIIVKDESWF